MLHSFYTFHITYSVLFLIYNFITSAITNKYMTQSIKKHIINCTFIHELKMKV